MLTTLGLIQDFNWTGVLFFMALGAVVALLARRSIEANLSQATGSPPQRDIQAVERQPAAEPSVRHVEHRHVHVLERKPQQPEPYLDVEATVVDEPAHSKCIVRR
jgi:hypothetical protein